ncbi:TetR/AcrR family transcriptional regulator [Amycolatopsis jiangsuensis]|uniref:AcrR family transcriptional regulator n=1 Tax=Amycolatopsis jiangsuensis TaxID=1181879 RepID=A0A840INH9_9PSEU|nr:TetR/AcrR family transcriptional regulator [Amycolatopsis jiangsuensis]MBB4683443.1 AcrR family transcriptional regulator [Amycolatopsis jiangsuensis]
MPRVSEQYKDDQRATILDAARRCFVRNGFHRTSMQDVFTEAGKSAGAVYRYFPRKEDLITGVATQNLDDVAAVLRTALARPGREIGEVLAELLEAVTQRHRDRDLATMAVMVWSEALRDPRLAGRLEAATVRMTEDLAGHLGERHRTPAEAQVLLSLLPGFLFNLALFGPRAVGGFPEAVRSLWSQ